MLAYLGFCASQLVYLCSPQSQLRNHEKEHENLTSDTTALTATEGMTPMEEAEQEIGGIGMFSIVSFRLMAK